MAGLLQESAAIMEDRESLLHPVPISRPAQCRSRKAWTLGAVVLGVVVFVGLGGISHRQQRSYIAPRAVISEQLALAAEEDSAGGPPTAAEKAPPLIGGMTPGGESDPKNADAKVQALADAVKDQVPDKLREQGWHLGLGDFKVISYCQQVVAGMNYIMKVEIEDNKVPRVANGGEVLQLSLFQPLGSSNSSTSLTSVEMVARDDRSCAGMPLSPPPALPHVVFDATPQVQELADAVKEKVPAMLALSGWRPSLEPFKAIDYCGDSLNYIIKVKVADCLDKNCTYPIPYQLQLLVHVPHGKGAEEAVLTGALMVQVLNGSCASLPVLPTLDEASAQALGDVKAPNASSLALAAAAISADVKGKAGLLAASAAEAAKSAKGAADSVTDAVTGATKAAKGAATEAAKSADGAADAASGALGKAAKSADDAADGATAAVANATDDVTHAATEAAKSAADAASGALGKAAKSADDAADGATAAVANATDNVTDAATEVDRA